jgi:hypothetical protein
LLSAVLKVLVGRFMSFDKMPVVYEYIAEASLFVLSAEQEAIGKGAPFRTPLR